MWLSHTILQLCSEMHACALSSQTLKACRRPETDGYGSWRLRGLGRVLPWIANLERQSDTDIASTLKDQNTFAAFGGV